MTIYVNWWLVIHWIETDGEGYKWRTGKEKQEEENGKRNEGDPWFYNSTHFCCQFTQKKTAYGQTTWVVIPCLQHVINPDVLLLGRERCKPSVLQERFHHWPDILNMNILPFKNAVFLWIEFLEEMFLHRNILCVSPSPSKYHSCVHRLWSDRVGVKKVYKSGRKVRE